MATEWVFGVHAVLAVLHKKPENINVLYVQLGRMDKRIQELLALAQEKNITVEKSERRQLDQMTSGAIHQGIVAQCHIESTKKYSEDDIERILDELNEPPFIMILDGVQDPHNLGACLRSANAAGVHMVVAPRDRSVGITPAVRKVASGAAEATPFIQVTNLARTLRFLKERGVWLYGAAEEGKRSIFQVDYRGAVALLFGAEGSGLRRLTEETCDELVFIPMHGTVPSLNVSVAAAVCLFEVVRQRISP